MDRFKRYYDSDVVEVIIVTKSIALGKILKLPTCRYRIFDNVQLIASINAFNM